MYCIGSLNFKSSEEINYAELSTKLNASTNYLIRKRYLKKLYAVLFPEIFVPIFAFDHVDLLLEFLELEHTEDYVINIGNIANKICKLEVSNIEFMHIYYKYINPIVSCDLPESHDTDSGENKELNLGNNLSQSYSDRDKNY